MTLSIRKIALLILFSVAVPIWAGVDYSTMTLQELENINANDLEKKERRAFTKARKKAQKQAEKEQKAKIKAEGKAKKERKKQAELEAIQNVPVCFTEYNCERKWAAARDWVNRNAGYKIQIYSDDLIETYNSTSSSTALHARVTKTLLGDVGGSRVYAIGVTVGCDNIFGCSPKEKDSVLNFNKVVGAINTSDPECYENLVHSMKSTPPIGIYAIDFYHKVLVKQVCFGSPADQAEIQVDDIVTSIDEVAVFSLQDLRDGLATVRAGDLVNIGIRREPSDLHIEVNFPNISELDKYARPEAKKFEKTAEDRLSELEHLFDSGLITKEEYTDKRKGIIDSL
jgi:hypothetical protein